jgi:dTDP-4-dehydrorhamnose reductase
VKILLIGCNGQLGWELQRACMTLGQVMALDYPQIDIRQSAVLRELIQSTRPDVLLNPAAYTNVEKAEIERETALDVNGRAPGVMAEEMKKLGGVFIHYSTDYVFDGKKRTPYTEEDAPNPLNEYGSSKLAGEQAVQAAGGGALIFRTSWVYSLRIGGFVNKVLQWSRQQEVMRVVDDQTGSPTWARMLAEATALVIARGGNDISAFLHGREGIYHLAGSGAASRYEWAREVIARDPAKTEQVVKELLPAKSDEFPSRVTRPAYSALDCSRFEHTFGIPIPDWKLGVQLALS